jgi:predicted enzyme related to lactoylglutathione lyase
MASKKTKAKKSAAAAKGAATKMGASKTAMKAPAKKAAKKAAAKKAAPKASAKKAKAPAKRASARKAAKVHQIVHWEIQARDPSVLHRFYAEALGWMIDTNNPMGYGMVSSGGKDGIDGGIGSSESDASRVLVYAEVKSIPDMLERIESLGGRTLMPRTEMGPVIMALYADPEGNTMGLLEA